MKHLSIEGMDGVGKSTICELLAERLHYRFVTKPIHYLIDEDESEWTNYFRVRDIVNSNQNRTFTSWFYSLGLIYSYELFKDENIITDRHIVSNYCWSGTKDNNDIFDLVIKKIGKPTLTVILYANSKTIKQRLLKRDVKDSDLSKVNKSEDVYNKMISFCELKKLPYVVIDSSKLTPNEIVDIIVEKYKGVAND